MNMMNDSTITKRARQFCPISSAAAIIADHWSLIILRDIAILNRRTFREILKKNNENISSAILAKRLKRLCDLGLLTTAQDDGHSQRKIYSLTASSIDTVPMLIDMSCWTFKHSGTCTDHDGQIALMRSAPSEYSSQLVEKLRVSHLREKHVD